MLATEVFVSKYSEFEYAMRKHRTLEFKSPHTAAKAGHENGRTDNPDNSAREEGR